MTSVAPPSPQVCRAKRGRLSADLDYCSPHGKRSRYVAQLDSNESGRFGAVKNRLQSLFPDMDEKVRTAGMCPTQTYNAYILVTITVFLRFSPV